MNRARVSRNSLTLDSFSREIISREGGELLVGKEELRINLRINRPVQEIKNIGILNCSAHGIDAISTLLILQYYHPLY